MSHTNRVVRGIIRARIARARLREYAEPKPAPQRAGQVMLSVSVRFVCQRWQGLCEGHYAVDFQTKRTAAYAAAQEAFQKRLRRGVALRDIYLLPDPIRADVYTAQLREKEAA